MRTVLHVYTENVELNLAINFLSACHKLIMFTRSTFKSKYNIMFLECACMHACGMRPQAPGLINRNMTKECHFKVSW